MRQSNLAKTSTLNPYRSALSRSRVSLVCKSHGPSNANRYIDRWVCSDSRKRFYPSSPMSSSPRKGIALPPMLNIGVARKRCYPSSSWGSESRKWFFTLPAHRLFYRRADVPEMDLTLPSCKLHESGPWKWPCPFQLLRFFLCL